MSVSASIYQWEEDYGEGLAVYVEGVKIGEVFTSYDCPEDNTVRRLGLVDLVEACLEGNAEFVHHYDYDPELDT